VCDGSTVRAWPRHGERGGRFLLLARLLLLRLLLGVDVPFANNEVIGDDVDDRRAGIALVTFNAASAKDDFAFFDSLCVRLKTLGYRSTLRVQESRSVAAAGERAHQS
jgi:hypothetical protein